MGNTGSQPHPGPGMLELFDNVPTTSFVMEHIKHMPLEDQLEELKKHEHMLESKRDRVLAEHEEEQEEIKELRVLSNDIGERDPDVSPRLAFMARCIRLSHLQQKEKADLAKAEALETEISAAKLEIETIEAQIEEELEQAEQQTKKSRGKAGKKSKSSKATKEKKKGTAASKSKRKKKDDKQKDGDEEEAHREDVEASPKKKKKKGRRAAAK